MHKRGNSKGKIMHEDQILTYQGRGKLLFLGGGGEVNCFRTKIYVDPALSLRSKPELKIAENI